MRGSGGIAARGIGGLGAEPPTLSAGRFFNENDVILGIIELKFLLQNIF